MLNHPPAVALWARLLIPQARLAVDLGGPFRSRTSVCAASGELIPQARLAVDLGGPFRSRTSVCAASGELKCA